MNKYKNNLNKFCVIINININKIEKINENMKL